MGPLNGVSRRQGTAQDRTTRNLPSAIANEGSAIPKILRRPGPSGEWGGAHDRAARHVLLISGFAARRHGATAGKGAGGGIEDRAIRSRDGARDALGHPRSRGRQYDRQRATQGRLQAALAGGYRYNG